MKKEEVVCVTTTVPVSLHQALKKKKKKHGTSVRQLIRNAILFYLSEEQEKKSVAIKIPDPLFKRIMMQKERMGMPMPQIVRNGLNAYVSELESTPSPKDLWERTLEHMKKGWETMGEK